MTTDTPVMNLQAWFTVSMIFNSCALNTESLYFKGDW